MMIMMMIIMIMMVVFIIVTSSPGEGLITNGHYAEQEIQARLDGLDTLWKQLQDSSLLKKERLQEAYQVRGSRSVGVDVHMCVWCSCLCDCQLCCVVDGLKY